MTNLLLLGFLPSGSEWIIIALVILLLFGGKKIPQLGKTLGASIKGFKDGMKHDPNNKEVEVEIIEEDKKKKKS